MKKEYQSDGSYYVKQSAEWLVALNELKVENILLKNRLSETISGQVDLKFIEQAECFQQRFVEKDQVIDLLRHEISILLQKVSDRGKITNSGKFQCAVLERDIHRLVYEFQQMKISFISLLSRIKDV
ncbi:hypothetical protein A8C56_07465 [Niabella ginsenosidivorans]|uniref:Uncharacterized protein n=1 Tax=Niabella ginsenosidivorans TaxID=1176587 RepID=A0A1A9I2A0_9BACT|nr:hypothetical protein [Niabella ginsenosidivorans]ANH80840.1 hypothetical protein A8C56_07465 [Niabella ginsenosidivorans]